MKNDKMKRKCGSTIVTVPIIVLFSMIFIFILGQFFVNAIKPFIWYEKLNSITNKYMFVIEKFGYLTNDEKLNLEKELVDSGFSINNITLEFPNYKKPYGELLQFSIKYKLQIKLPSLSMGKYDTKQIDIVVKKHSFSKI